MRLAESLIAALPTAAPTPARPGRSQRDPRRTRQVAVAWMVGLLIVIVLALLWIVGS